jgi:hypothetical protein
MSLDLNDILRDWPHQSGTLQVRRIDGSDGKPKIQLRLDLGVLQFELSGRPDGTEPYGLESLLEFHQQRAKEAEEAGNKFELTAEEVGDLQGEGIQYYHRYVALFQMSDWQGVVRDTRRNLDMFTFVEKYAPDEELAWSVQQFRPYVLMMNTRAKASLALDKEDVDAAIGLVEKGIATIQKFLKDSDEAEQIKDNVEIASLRDWMKELKKKRKITPEEKLKREMEAAIKAEQYEKAASLRDELRALQKND